MVVCQKQPANFTETNTQLMQSLHSAAPGIENKFALANFDERARSKALQTGRRRARAEERDAK
jgi:hypothetical protein